KFVTRITNFVTCVRNFVTLVTNFVTNFFLADRKKYPADSENCLPASKKYPAENSITPCLKNLVLAGL
ncbi:MAG: hypothetical protein ACI3X6_03425, partial [Alloprevotella sp.]